MISPDDHAGDTRHIRSGIVEIIDKSDLDWVCIHRNHDRSFRGRVFGGERGWTAEGGYQRNVPIEQAANELRQSRIVASSRTVFDHQVVFGKPFDLQPSVKGRKLRGRRSRAVQNAYGRFL